MLTTKIAMTLAGGLALGELASSQLGWALVVVGVAVTATLVTMRQLRREVAELRAL